MTAGSGSEAVARGRGWSSYETGMCLKFVRGPCWDVGSLYGSAIEAWNGAREKHDGDRTPPVGAPCFYAGGQYGHAVIHVGNGRVRSTDTPGTGSVGEVPLDHFEKAWGYRYLGWTGDINSVDLPLSGGTGEGLDDVGLQDEIAEWSPDEGSTGEITVGMTLNQARGYAEDGYQRVKNLQAEVKELHQKLDQLLAKLD